MAPVELRRSDDQVEQEHLQQIAEHEEQQHRDRQCRERIDPGLRIEVVERVAAQHDERAVRQIDDLEDAPDEAHAEPHQAVEAAEQDPVDQDLAEEEHLDAVPAASRR